MRLLMRSIQLRLVLALVLTVSVFAAAAGALAFHLGFERALQSGRANLYGMLLAIEKTASVGVFAADAVLLREVVDGLARSPLAAHVRVIDAQRRTLAEAHAPDGAVLATGETPIDVQLDLHSPFNANEKLGSLEVVANMSVLRQAARAEATLLAQLLIGLTVVLAVWVHLLVRYFVSRPIEQLARSLVSMKPGTDQRMPIPGQHRHDEIGALIGSTNQLLTANQLALVRERDLRAHVERMEAQYRNLFQSSSAGMFVLADGAVLQWLHANPTTYQLLGLPIQADLEGAEPPRIELAFAQPDAFLSLIAQARESGLTASADLELVSSTDRPRWVHCLVSWHSGVTGEPAGHTQASGNVAPVVEGVLYDVSDRKHVEVAIRHRAEHDPLTGLRNRSGADAGIDRLLLESASEHTPLSVLYLDLDGFKRVNDQHGHKAGDQVLVECARRMRRVIRRGSDLCARMGGDEFVVVMPGTAPSEVHLSEVALALIESLQQPYALEDGTLVHIGASVGIACCPQHGHSRKELLHMADMALYEVKRTGKSTFALALGHRANG